MAIANLAKAIALLVLAWLRHGFSRLGHAGTGGGRVRWGHELQPSSRCLVCRYDHPMADTMQRVRRTILSDDRITETIKWKSPTFMYQGNMASFDPRTKAHVGLMFHTGAAIPGDHPRLIGGGETARYMKFENLDDAVAAEAELLAIVDAWCTSRD